MAGQSGGKQMCVARFVGFRVDAARIDIAAACQGRFDFQNLPGIQHLRIEPDRTP